MYYTISGHAAFSRDIICVLSADNATTGRDTRAFLKRCEQNGVLISGDEEPRFIVVTQSSRGEGVFFTTSRPRSIA